MAGASCVQGLLINPGWEIPGATGAAAVAGLTKLPLPRLCPVGFVFIWVDKQHIAPVVKQMSRWGFVYIENLTWVLTHANHSILRLPSAYAQRSHLTLFLFRKEGAQAPTTLCSSRFISRSSASQWSDKMDQVVTSSLQFFGRGSRALER